MKISLHYFLKFLFPILGTVLFISACEDQVNLETDRVVTEDNPQPMNFKSGDPFEDAEVFFEFNSTDNDLGLQLFIDNTGWNRLSLRDADGNNNLELKASGPLGALGITELRFESSEPSPEGVLASFPPGDYSVRGKTVDGDKLLSVVEVSHDFLEPAIITPEDGDVVDPGNVVVTWESEGAESVEIIIEDEEEEGIISILVSEDEGELTMPPEYFEAGTEYKLEVISTAENGNKTIIENEFMTNGAAI